MHEKGDHVVHFHLKHISGTIAAIDLNHGKIIVLSFCYIPKDICAPPISGMGRATMHVDGIRQLLFQVCLGF